MPSNFIKNIEIEVLRAIAILFVVLHHVPVLFKHQPILPYWFESNFGFWTGVDLFFVISGFLICRSLMPIYDNKSGVKGIITKYAIKRIFRILPAAIFWVLLSLLFSVILPINNTYPSLLTLFNDAIAALLHFSNFYYAYCLDTRQMGELCSNPQPLGPFWSLSLEEQFYILLPIFMIFTPRGIFIAFLISIITLGFFWHRPILGFGWYARIDGLLWGVFLAHISVVRTKLSQILFQMKYDWPRWLANLILFVFLAYLAKVGGASLSGLHQTWTPAISCVSLVSAVLVFFASLDRGYLFKTGFLTHVMAKIGARSYSIYLCHTPILIASIVLIDYLYLPSEFHGTALVCLSFFLIAIATEFTHQFIEKPTRNYGVSLAAKF